MGASVSVQLASPRMLAAVRRQVRIGHVATAWRPALDLVWAFLRQTPGLRTDGHNIFLYHHAAKGESTMAVDFGVQVTRSFPQSGEVFATETPAGKVASVYTWVPTSAWARRTKQFNPGCARITRR
jgi:hypothetical protein